MVHGTTYEYGNRSRWERTLSPCNLFQVCHIFSNGWPLPQIIILFLFVRDSTNWKHSSAHHYNHRRTFAALHFLLCACGRNQRGGRRFIKVSLASWILHTCVIYGRNKCTARRRNLFCLPLLFLWIDVESPAAEIYLPWIDSRTGWARGSPSSSSSSSSRLRSWCSKSTAITTGSNPRLCSLMNLLPFITFPHHLLFFSAYSSMWPI